MKPSKAFDVSHSAATKSVGTARRKYSLLPATTAGKPSDPYQQPPPSTAAKRPTKRARKGTAR
jgi:hypothetical protein